MAKKTIRMASIGGGMFGRGVVLHSLASIDRCGITPYLATAGLDHHAREFEGVEFKYVAVGERYEHLARGLVKDFREWSPGSNPRPYWGETPWVDLLDNERPDVLFVATPDHLHTPVVLAALDRGVHVVCEKPLTLHVGEVRTIIEKARQGNLVVAVDMHKRYDAFLRSAFVDVVPRLGDLIYGRAVLEEPLEIPTRVFRWADRSNPFSYVGVHWTDLFGYYLKLKPVSLHAVGQKKVLVNWRDDSHPDGIDTFDAMQVTVQYDNGMSVQYVNSWINPPDFEGHVNQEMEIIGAKGRVFVDQQDRGMRSAIAGAGSRTHNPHFQAEIPRAGGHDGSVGIGYHKDSLVAGLDAAARVRLGLTDRAAIAGTYADAESALSLVAILEAAAEVAAANQRSLAAGRGVPFSARFDGDAWELVGPVS